MTAAQPAVLLEHYLKQWKLPTIVREYARLAAVCTQDRSDYATYLLRLAEREGIEREHRAAERRVNSKSGGEVLFEVVSRAYERTSLIVTTNLPFESWTEVLGSERLTGRCSTASPTGCKSSRRSGELSAP